MSVQVNTSPVDYQLLTERYEVEADVILRRLAPLFIQTTPQLLDQLGCQSSDGVCRDSVRTAAHTLRGNSASVCATTLEHLARTLENSADSAACADICQLSQAISAEAARVLEALADHTVPI